MNVTVHSNSTAEPNSTDPNIVSKAKSKDPSRDDDWRELAINWQIRPDTIYLNHGSFGPAPWPVKAARKSWIDATDWQPMDFYVRQLEPAWNEARRKLARFVGVRPKNLVFVENSTVGMNVVADSFLLREGDEVILNDHVYGAVYRIWLRKCQRSGAKIVSVALPSKIEAVDQVVDTVMGHVTDRTRLVVISHITSPTALVMPVSEICRACRERDIAVCIDGPHAVAQLDLHIGDLDCDFYTASCHKWLSATLGSGFLYVDPRWHANIEPVVKSWGRLLPAMPESWDEEFIWSGTRDVSAFLSVPAAIEFIEQVGLNAFQARTRWLASYAEDRLCDFAKTEPIANRSDGWYASMAHVPLPAGDWSHLQRRLWETHQIEVPIIDFNDRWFIRVSCHLYNNQNHIDTLVAALRHLSQ